MRRPVAPAARGSVAQPLVAHCLDAVERLDRADEHCRGVSDGLGDHVQGVIHPVDKVHVGDARRAEHDRRSASRTEAGVRRLVLGPQVRLHLDDAADPHLSTGRRRHARRLAFRRALRGGVVKGRIADENGTEQRAGGVERGSGEECAVHDRAVVDRPIADGQPPNGR